MKIDGLTACIIALILGVMFTALRSYVRGNSVSDEMLAANRPLNKTVIITGGNVGIGLETAVFMAYLGANVIITVRDDEKGQQALKRIKKSGRSETVRYEIVELSDLNSVRAFAKKIEDEGTNVDILINNAGIMMKPHDLSAQGFEIHLATNYLSHFLLTDLLLPNLRKNKGRVINVSAGLAKFGDIDYDFKSKQEYSNGLLLYAQSKLAQILFTQELNDRYGEDITTYSLHPGVVRTEIGREFPILRYLMMPIGYLLHKTPKEGAQTTVFAALVDKNIIPSGSYLENCEKHDVSPFKYTSPEDKSVREKLWSSSVDAVKLTE